MSLNQALQWHKIVINHSTDVLTNKQITNLDWMQIATIFYDSLQLGHHKSLYCIEQQWHSSHLGRTIYITYRQA